MTDRTFSFLEVEAALCIWEWINDVTLLIPPDKTRQNWVELRKAVGSVELRYNSAMLYAPWLLSIYDICTKDNKEFFEQNELYSYDWDVVPKIMSYIDPSADSLPDPQKTAEKIMKELAPAVIQPTEDDLEQAFISSLDTDDDAF